MIVNIMTGNGHMNVDLDKFLPTTIPRIRKLFLMMREGTMKDDLDRVSGYLENRAKAAAEDLVGKTEELRREEDGREVYALTGSGLQAANTFGKDLPLSVRERAVGVARGILTRQRREKEIVTDIQRVEDGYRLVLRLTDIGSDLLDIGIFLPSEEACQRVRQRFLDDPMELYKGILDLLTGGESASPEGKSSIQDVSKGEHK